MKNLLKVALFILVSSSVNAQVYNWTTTNSPPISYRFEDVFFLNPDTGFAVHYNDLQFGGQPGYIMRTMDAGNSWIKVVDSSQCKFRDIGFTDELHGFAGTIEHTNTGSDTSIIYKTTDGGLTWAGVDNLPGPDSAGICGLRVINDSTIYGVGRYYGPANFYKTTNNGASWSYVNLDSLVSGLVDAFFFNADTGFAIGTTGPSYSNGYGRILYTTDGGTSWNVAATSAQQFTLGWKIVFPSRNVGYCSLQKFNFTTQTYLKTVDGGITWQELFYGNGPVQGYNVEGIGFINDTVGWVGGDPDVYFTQNGGASWTVQHWGDNLNRFRFLSDSIGYAAGMDIYKLHVTPTGIRELNQNGFLKSYPNPSATTSDFEFALPATMNAKLVIYDINGKQVEVVFDKMMNQGIHHFLWRTDHLNNGVYMSVLSFGKQVIKRKLEIIK